MAGYRIAALFLLCGVVNGSNATLISVAGPNSSLGVAPAIIGAPAHMLDDIATNTGMQGFNEAQGVVTTVNHSIDGGGFIAAGTRVDSHMIFLNSAGTTRIDHAGVTWTFADTILGVMSDLGGTLEAASTFELGNPGTNYTATFVGSGPAAPFPNRGLEPNDSIVVSGNQITLGMIVTEPGDWIRVVTASRIPEPSTIALLGLGLAGIGFARRRKLN